jgi:hypothetical protein
MGGFDPNDSTTWGFTGTFFTDWEKQPKYIKIPKDGEETCHYSCFSSWLSSCKVMME